MKKAYFFILILCSIILGSCEKNITLDIPKYNSKPVVFSVLLPGRPPQLSLSLSQSYYSYADTDTSVNNHLITNARVYITDLNTNKTDTFKEDTFGQKKIYFGKQNIISGHSYFLHISYNGKTLTAQTTVPMPVKIDHVDYVKLDTTFYGGPNYEFQVYFNDLTGGPNYFTLDMANFISDAGLAGKQLELKEDLYLPLVYPITVQVLVYNANKETSDFLTNSNIQAQNANNPFSEPVIVEGNINGGLGLFGAMTQSPFYTVVIPK